MALRPANGIRIVKTWFGVDDLGAGTARAGDQITALNLSGRGIPGGLRYGMKGGHSTTFRGDLGPLQAFGAIGHARGAVRAGNAKALPGTNGAIVAPSTVRSLLGPDPLR